MWEFKCVTEIDNTHIIQLAIYMYMIETTDNNNGEEVSNNYFIFNILNNQILEINSDIGRLKQMLSLIFESKYGNKQVSKDNVFIKKNLEIRNRWS